MVMVMDTVMGKKNTPDRITRSVAIVCALGMGLGAHAQNADTADSGAANAAPKRLITVLPRVSVTYTATDNLRLASSAAQAGQIVQLSPGLNISMQGARLKAYLDYALTGLYYTGSASPNSAQNALTTFGSLEAIDNFAFVDFTGSIAQQAASAFGQQSIGNANLNPNRVEVGNYRLSPYIKGRIGDAVNYEARISRAVTTSAQSNTLGANSVATAANNTNTTDSSVRLNGGSGFRKLGWTADVSKQTVDYSLGRQTESERSSLGLTFALTPQLSVNASAGREANNFNSIDIQQFVTNSVGFSWRPSASTTISGARDQRFFGAGHKFNFEHRTPRTVWRFSDSRDVSPTPSQGARVGLGSLYDLLYTQFESQFADPTARAQAVTTYLQTNGLTAAPIVSAGFLTSAVALQRRQDLSFALLGIRSTATFIATQASTNRLDLISTAVDDFSKASVVNQNGLSANFSHRLTPDSSLGLLFSQQKTAGSTSVQESTLRSISVSISSKIGQKATASLTARKVESEGGLVPYVENAFVGILNVPF